MEYNISNYTQMVQMNNGIEKALIPLIVLFGLFSVVGVFGNALVCYIFFYRLKRSKQHILIGYLAIFDFIICAFSIPAEIVDLRFYYEFHSDAFCKATKFTLHLFLNASVLTLVVIAADRYRHVCKWWKKQLTIRATKWLLLPILITAVVAAGPVLESYGVQVYALNGTTMAVRRCTHVDPYRGLYNGFKNKYLGSGALVALAVSLATLYSLILREHFISVRRLREFQHPQRGFTLQESFNPEQTMLQDNRNPSSALITGKEHTPESDSNVVNQCKRIKQQTKQTQSYTLLTKTKELDESTVVRSAKSLRTTRTQKRMDSTASLMTFTRQRKITVVACVVTVVFILSYLPYWCVELVRINHYIDPHLTGIPLFWFVIGLRSPFINSILNPVIYGVMNAEFRDQVKLICRKMFRFQLSGLNPCDSYAKWRITTAQEFDPS